MNNNQRFVMIKLAEQLNGRQYDGLIISETEAQIAAESGLVVLYGNEHQMIFKGAISKVLSGCDEEGIIINVTSGGEVLDHSNKGEEVQIELDWPNEFSPVWGYRTDIPHETFMIWCNGEPYSQGIIFTLADVGGQKRPAAQQDKPISRDETMIHEAEPMLVSIRYQAVWGDGNLGGFVASTDDTLKTLKAHLAKYAPKAVFIGADCYDKDGNYLRSYEAEAEAGEPTTHYQNYLKGEVRRLEQETIDLRNTLEHAIKVGNSWRDEATDRGWPAPIPEAETGEPIRADLLLAADGWTRGEYNGGTVYNKEFYNEHEESGYVYVDFTSTCTGVYLVIYYTSDGNNVKIPIPNIKTMEKLGILIEMLGE